MDAFAYSLAGMAAVTMFTLLGLIYMVGAILDNRQMKERVKAELLQAVATVLIVAFLAGYTLTTTGEVQSAASQITGIAIPGMDQVKTRIKGQIDALRGVWGSVYGANYGTEASEWSCWMVLNGYQQCNYGVHSQVEMNHAIGYKATSLMMSLYAQKFMVGYAEDVLVQFFLPAAILLRIFPPTRGIGGLLMAMVIGFLIVFPIFYVIGSVATGTAAAATTITVEQATAEIGQMTFAVVWNPIIALSVAVVFIRALAPMLGGDSDYLVQGISKLT